MTYLSDVLHGFTAEVYGYFELIATLVWGILRAASSFGALLVDAFALLFFGVTSLVTNAAHALMIILEDFGAFVTDIVDVYIVTQNSLRSFVDGLSCAVLVMSNALFIGVNTVLETILAVIMNASYLLCWSGSVVKDTIILIGNSTMLLLQSIPWSITIFFQITKYVTVTLFWFICSLPAYLMCAFVTLIVCVYDRLSEIPLYTYTGVIIAVILAWLARHAMQSSSCKRLIYAVMQKLSQSMSRRTHRTINDSLNSSVEHQESEPEAEPSVSRKEDSPQTVMRQLETERNEKLCVVCRDEPKCVILLPCRHLCLCRQCQTILLHTDPACPICRRRIADTLHVYI